MPVDAFGEWFPNGGVPKFTPSPEQIREGCERIQAGWTDQERAYRRTGMTLADLERALAWQPPVCQVIIEGD